MKSLQVTVSGNAAVTDAPWPPLHDDYILAKTKVVALNPTDYRHLTRFGEPGAILGRDWSGIVLEVGKNITRFKRGDEVLGCCRGGKSR
jgi:NADPH:quinone reductase-like Zn-dependent oxidoreductase